MKPLIANAEPLLSNAFIPLSRSYAKCGMAIWRMWWDLGFGYAERATAEIVEIGLARKRPDQALQTLLVGVRNYWTEMINVLPTAVDGLSRDIDQSFVQTGPSKFGVAPKQSPTTHVIRDVPVMMPVRIADAAQGWVLYLVSAPHAQSHLAKLGQPFTVVDIGGGRTPIVLLGMDYRGTDLGAYQEIGVTLFVQPHGDRRATPGVLFLSLTVSDEFNVERARVLWGYNKTFARDFAVTNHPGVAGFAIDRNDPTALAISFPRFGNGRSTNICCYTYGTRQDSAGKEIPFKTLISRSATGEGWQIGGAVDLRLGDGTQTRCVCRLAPGSSQACVCLVLRELGLPKPPAASGWAEHMSAQVSDATSCGASLV